MCKYISGSETKTGILYIVNIMLQPNSRLVSCLYCISPECMFGNHSQLSDNSLTCLEWDSNIDLSTFGTPLVLGEMHQFHPLLHQRK